MRYLPPIMKHLEDSEQINKWTPEEYIWNGFSMNGRTYVLKFCLYLHVGDFDPKSKSKWVSVHSEEYMPIGVMQACRLWKKVNYNLPLYMFLDGMFGE